MLTATPIERASHCSATHANCANLPWELVANIRFPDRPLQHINKKGRPVSQCSHCRNMRRSKSAHVKCDCGEKTTKCAHLQQPLEGHKGELELGS